MIPINPSTAADVQLLWDVFPDLLPDGREITHAQIEAVLKMRHQSSRYRSVVTKWRRQLFRERGVYLDGQVAQGRGFIALAPDEMVRFGNRRVREAGRKFRKGLAVLAAPRDEDLSLDMRRYRQLLEATVVKITHDNRSALRDVARAMAPQPQLPRAQPVEER